MKRKLRLWLKFREYCPHYRNHRYVMHLPEHACAFSRSGDDVRECNEKECPTLPGKKKAKKKDPEQVVPEQEPPKQDLPEQVAPEQEAPKQEAPEQEPPKQEAPKQETGTEKEEA